MTPPKKYWASRLAMSKWRTVAEDWLPKSEHGDLRCYVLKADYDKLQEKLKPLVEALRFYADEAQYQAIDIIEGVEVLEITNDQGDRAREALKELDAIMGGGDV